MNKLMTNCLYFLAPINTLLSVQFFARPWLPSWASRIEAGPLMTSLALVTLVSVVVLFAWGITASAVSWQRIGRAAISAAVVVGLNCLISVGHLLLVLSGPI
jgi:hypothetical protein